MPEALDHHRDHEARLDRVNRLATLLDASFRVPGTRIRFGWDAIIGLVPGLGDLVTGGIALKLLYEAHRMGLGTPILLRMGLNIAIDVLLGGVPIIGDLIDVAWKGNLRNAKIVRKAMEKRMASTPRTRPTEHRDQRPARRVAKRNR